MEVWSDRGSTCKYRNARSAFRNLHVDPLSLHTSMRNKPEEFNPYIYTLTTLSNCTVLATKYPFFNTKHPVIILRSSLFAVTPSHVASSKIECQNFSYDYRSRKHWECKYKGVTWDIIRKISYIISNTYKRGVTGDRGTKFKCYYMKRMVFLVLTVTEVFISFWLSLV